MNQNYVRYQITRDGKQVSEADWFYVESTIAIERSDIYVGFLTLSLPSMTTGYLQLLTSTKDTYLIDYSITTNSARITEKILEAPSLTTGTTPYLMMNTNRVNPVAHSFSIFTNPTNITGGTTIDQVESYDVKKVAPSVASASQKRIKFKPSTNYILSIYNGDNSTNSVFVKWYIMEL